MDTRAKPVRHDYFTEEADQSGYDADAAIGDLFDEVLKEAAEQDIVKRPSHYTRWVIEPIEFIMRNGMEFWRGNVIKYVCRAGFKLYPGADAVESEIIDLEKAIRYCEMRINQLKGDTVL